jgi:aminoglycoside 2'-N-acetyltransferase I
VRIEIKRNDKLASSEQRSIRDLAQVFGAAASDYTWAPVDWHVLVWIGRRLVSHVEIIERTGTVDGRAVRLGGIGGVASAPEWRGRGHATRAMEEATRFLCTELNAEFGLLLCGQEMTPFYRRLGWKTVDGPLVFDQPAGKVTQDGVVMVLPCAGQEWPSGTIDLCGLPW